MAEVGPLEGVLRGLVDAGLVDGEQRERAVAAARALDIAADPAWTEWRTVAIATLAALIEAAPPDPGPAEGVSHDLRAFSVRDLRKFHAALVTWARSEEGVRHQDR